MGKHCLVLSLLLLVGGGLSVRLKQGSHSRRTSRIPPQLIITGKQASFEALPSEFKSNIGNTLALSHGLEMRYFNDTGCRDYLKAHLHHEFLSFFDMEKHGSFRGDLCRAAILSREGGFYTDLDIQIRKSLWDMVDDSTTFMSVRSAYDGVMNALIAVTPRDPIMNETLEHIRKWYRKETLQELPLGPVTLQRGLESTMAKYCKQKSGDSWSSNRSTIEFQRECGSEVMRLYNEELIAWGNCSFKGASLCPPSRATSIFPGSKFGIFAVGPQDEVSRCVGWSHADFCQTNGCGVNGGLASFF